MTSHEAWTIIHIIMLNLEPEERTDVISSMASAEFCMHCGMGDVDQPNYRCQCTNDE